MKKLLQINTTVGRTAPGVIAAAIGRLAEANDWESHIAYGRPSSVDRVDPCNNLYRIGSPFSIALHGMSSRFFDNHGCNSRGATKDLLKYIEHLGPDLVHLHNIHGYYLNYRLLFDFLRGAGIPVVWTLHDVWPITGHCAFFNQKNCIRWRMGCHDCPSKRSYPASLWRDHSPENYETKRRCFTGVPRMQLTAVSGWLKNTIEESFLGDYPVDVIYNGINVSNHVEHTRSRRSPLLLGVAYKWVDLKGLDDFGRLRAALPSGFRIRLVGLTQKQIKKLPRGIEGVERIDDPEKLMRLYAQASVLVNLSHGETFGMVNIEAQNCGTPVICYNVGGAPE
ncbi:MAG: glycosyltransferase, partial [Muribaculaceae bacterium]|nr:glycosyltransferase [Muribaculaceae bacterium]